MEAFDYMQELVVPTPLGPVRLSLAGDEIGDRTVVAWLVPAGRRVGFVRQPAQPGRLAVPTVDPALAGTRLGAAMMALLDDYQLPAGRPSPQAMRHALAAPGRRDLN